MSRLTAAFARRKAFIPFIVAGHPTPAALPEILALLADAGADAIEVGLPFSDPVADGPVIQRAAGRAIEQGMMVARALEAVAKFRAASEVPVVLFTYLNPLLANRKRDPQGLAIRAAADAVLLLDLPMEESGAIDVIPAGVERIYLAAPSTADARLARIAEAAPPFVYYVSRYGVTGARADVPEDLGERVAHVRRLTGKPVAVGFGVSTPDQARAVAKVADGVVVGSAIVEQLSNNSSLGNVAEFVRSLAEAVHG